MPEIQAFHGVRYNLGHVGSLSDVVAPPYDVIGTELREELYKKHPCNVIRLILNREEMADDEANNRYTRAARFFKSWQTEGLLFSEAKPAIYVYDQEFHESGQHYVRRGFMARMRLSRFGEGQVFPHEETMRGPKIDRLMLTAVCKANLSQIFGLYPDAENETQSLLESAICDKTPIVANDHLGIIHRIWPVIDPEIISAVSGVIGPKPIFIADGHHRYETACDYREQIYDSGSLHSEHPANFVLMMCVAMEDPGLAVLPCHRLFRGIPDWTAADLTERLSPCFQTRPAGEGPKLAIEVWEDIETTNDQGSLALFTRADNRWTIVQLSDAGRDRMRLIASDHNEAWRGLGVAILHRLIIDELLMQRKSDDPPITKPTYVNRATEVVEELQTSEYPLAALVMPASVQNIREVSLQGERMPSKSTYFYPKLLSGLVMNPLE